MNLVIEYDSDSLIIDEVGWGNLETLEVLRSENTTPKGNITTYRDPTWLRSKTYNLSGVLRECAGKTLQQALAFLRTSAGKVTHCLYVNEYLSTRKEFNCIVLLTNNKEYLEIRPGVWQINLDLLEI